MTCDIANRWDVGFVASSLFGNGQEGRKHGLGAELGYLVRENLWLSLGCNVLGFSDDDLAEEGYTDKGAFLRLRFKFDESGFSANTPPGVR